MSDIEIVSGDTAPTLHGYLKKKNDAGQTVVRPLTDVASVKFQMRREDDHRYTVDAAAAIVDAASGHVSYSWAPRDLAYPGEFIAQWELTFLDGKVQTTNPPNTITVRRQ